MATFGVCAGPERAQIVRQAGYDFIECGVTSHLAPLSGAERFEQTRQLLAAAGITPEAFNVFVGGVQLTGPDVDRKSVEAYVRTALERARSLGAQTIVFGSGGARRVPDGFARPSAWDQLAEFLTMTGPIAQEHGIIIAIEPLATKECNIINSVSEAVELARRVNHPSIRVLADIYHMFADGESYSAVSEAGDLLAHVHLSDPQTRKAPESGREPDSFLGALKKAGYDGRISLECAWDDFDSQAHEALETMKASWQAAG